MRSIIFTHYKKRKKCESEETDVLNLERDDAIIKMFNEAAETGVVYTKKQIAEKVGCSPQTVCNVLDRAGLSAIQHREHSGRAFKKSEKDRTCSVCRAKGHRTDAKFCWKCGADIRSDFDIAIDKLSLLGKYVAQAHDADDGINLLNEIRVLLTK